MTKPFSVTGVGHAIVDIIAQCQESLIAEAGLVKGSMRLTSPEEAAALYAKMGPAIETSGGSAANTCAAIASLGGSVAFMGKVGRDTFADAFTHDIRSIGVSFSPLETSETTPTGTCLIIVTPDGERTMNTNLGAAAEFSVADLDMTLVDKSEIIYLEGYLFDPPAARAAFHAAADRAHAAGAKVAFTLSDPFCVDRHRDAFHAFLSEKVDIVFANEHELLSLYPGMTFDRACASLSSVCGIAAITRSEKGSVVLGQDGVHSVPAAAIERLVDATGAGDLYAGGFLYGLAAGKPLADCAKLGGLAASEVIQHLGPRPQRSLRELAVEHGLL